MRFIFSLIFALCFIAPFEANAVVSHVVSAKTATGASGSLHFGSSLSNVNQVMECSGTTGSGTGAATIKLQGSNDGTNWIDIATCSLTLGTSVTASSVTNTANWYWYRVNVTAISGTSASVDAWVNY